MKRRHLFGAMGMMGVSALLLMMAVLSESARDQEPWLKLSPTHAEHHYGEWRSQSGGWALPGWQRFVIERDPPSSVGPVLVDQRHARKQGLFSDLSLTEVRYNRMHGLGGMRRLLQEQGHEFSLEDAELTASRLGGASLLFINLPSGDGPGFSHAEVVAIESFVHAGGGLVLLTDHSNAYFHAEMLAPLMQRFGLELPPVTACDKKFGHTMSPKTTTWLVSHVSQEHPVVRGVSRIAVMTAGAVVPKNEPIDWSVLASTSSSGWQDHWHPYRKAKSAGFTGNMSQDSDEPNEAVPILVAAEIGKGRVVVLGDQNAWGSIFIGLEDNAQLAVNAFAWAAGKTPGSIEAPAVEIVSGDEYACGTVSPKGYHSLFVAAARKGIEHGLRHSCRADPGSEAAARIWLPQRPPTPNELALGQRHVVLVNGENAAELSERLELRPQATHALEGPGHTAPGGQEVWLIDEPAWLQNQTLGRERESMRDANGQLKSEMARVFRVLDWAYGSP